MNFRPRPFAHRAHASGWPPELAVLQGRIDHAVLRRRIDALAPDACPVATLIAEGAVDAGFYYRTLAADLGLPFRDDWPEIAAHVDDAAFGAPQLNASFVRLADGDPARWLVAPQSKALRDLILAPRATREGLAITTPAHLAAVLHLNAQPAIERIACDALPSIAPQLSAKRLCGLPPKLAIAAILATFVAGWIVLPFATALALGAPFLASLIFKIAIVATADQPKRAAPPACADCDLPVYTLLVPLRDETEMIPQLLHALDRLDYPKAKLDVILVIEPEDRATRAALAARVLPPWLRVVFGPVGGGLRTKPRALNIGLLSARGTLLTVFDAEDRPDRGQLRAAAARFADAPPELACLQAILAIDNGHEGWLPRCFAIEYAALFDLLNVGLARLGLPVPLGGTSNHFRVALLRAAGGWDAWNVTEDAELGLRLARLGYAVESLDSVTLESAPRPLADWMKQRRRWTKGWMQTVLVLAADAPAAARALGFRRSAAVAMCLTNLLLGPMLYPLVCAGLVLRLAVSRWAGNGETNAWSLGFKGLFAFGILASLWCGARALRRRPAAGPWPALLLLPAYQLLVGVAGWMGLVDLWRAPYHWHKTAHPLVRRDVTVRPPARGRVPAFAVASVIRLFGPAPSVDHRP